MKILHYLPGIPPVMGGGMIKYALDLVQGEEHTGHEVILLIPGHFTHICNDKTRIIKKNWNKRELFSIINPLPVTCGKGISDLAELTEKGDIQVFVTFLEKARPEIIHVHSFMGLHLAFLEAATYMGIPVIYTTHDYYGICPKAILFHDMEQCIVTDGSQCSGCIEEIINIERVKRRQSVCYRRLKNNWLIKRLEYSQKLVPLKLFIRSLLQRRKQKNITSQSNIQNMEQTENYRKLQQYYREMFSHITKFHYNSRQSEEVFIQYLGNISGEVIPISNKNISDMRKTRKFGKTLRIGFIGREAYKGFGILKDALDSLYIEGLQDFECYVYFNPKEKLPSYIISHEPYNEENLEQVYDSMDVLILPSLWKETYGLVVPEALSRGIPVIVSNNVGSKELLAHHEGMGMVIAPTKETLKEALEKVYRNRDLLKQMNRKICECEFSFGYKEHIQKVVNMYQNIGRH